MLGWCEFLSARHQLLKTGMRHYAELAPLILLGLLGGCVEEPPGIVNVCVIPAVVRTSPANSQTDVALGKVGAVGNLARVAAGKTITATFNTPMDSTTLTAKTFILRQGSDTLSGTVSYSEADTMAMLSVPNNLTANRTYTCTITTGVKDKVGTALAGDYTWTFTTLAPGVPVLVSPVDGALNLGASLTLIWKTVAGADAYHIQVSTSPAFASLLYNDSTLADTSRVIAGLTYGTTYYWRVSAKISGVSGSYSTAWSFNTLAPPAPPVLVAPAASAVNQATSLVLSWNASARTDTYRLQVSTNAAFTTTLFNDSTLTGTSRLVSGLSLATTYYWRVNAKNVAGTSAYSTRSFTTIATPPLPPVLIAPADLAINVSTGPTLSWNASLGADTYRLQVSTNAAFTTTLFNDSTLTGTSRLVSGLSLGTTYYWRVNAKNAGGTSAYSTRSFTTITTPPLPPVLISPPDLALNISTSPTLVWNTSVGAATYRLQVSTNPAFSTTIFNDSTLTDTTSRPITGISVGTTYYWRVNAKNAGGTSAYSARSFTTIATAPLPPILIAPPNLAVNVSTTPTLSWNASVGADTYNVQVSTNPAFTNNVFSDSTNASLSENLTGLTPGATYFWRVNAKNSGGTSSYSSTQNFTVLP